MYKLYHAIITVTRNSSALSTAPVLDETLRFKAAKMLGKLGKYLDLFGTNAERKNNLIRCGSCS